MKKLIVYIALLAGFMTACKKEETEPATGQRPEERTAAALKKYQDALTGNKDGWIAYLYPDGGGGYSFYMTFSDSNRVNMIADLSFDMAADPMESSYKVRQAISPALFFDTYNYMHVLADPDANQNGGVMGWGLYSDFEFSIDTLTTDSMTMHGNLNDSKMLMVKATAAQAAAFKAGGLKSILMDMVNYTSVNQNLYLVLDGTTKVATSINFATKAVTLTWVDDKGVVNSIATPFATTLTGLTLKEPLVYNGKKITELLWDADKQELYAMVDGQKVTVQVSATPILPLHLLIGISYTDIIIPYATTYPGWGSDFVTRRAAASTSMANGPYGLRMDRLQAMFNVDNSKVTFELDIYQGSNKFIADFNYSYTKTADGVYTFTAAALSGNASLIGNDMAPLTKQRLNVDHFTLDYYVDQGTGQVLGQFKDVENPDFTFTGTLN
ncbi:hypothetical protein DCC81_16365 [Chitinophaga parva]|uniref:DUF4302 domain-containing protein n=1 Tax=Chitinophaga parva TaxID=2169414 RepID=A0A2T7BHS4_9BACT|nr:DUF4302 domain-containing protein [Chitinophaga parva]PUZ25830.1 hypothetical protein DCC81_16365 [Chitinophaga parva]